MKNLLAYSLFSLFLSFPLFSQVRLTEVAATNTGQVTDDDGDRPDWIELQNQGQNAVDIGNWGLSDGGKSNRWLLPSQTLQPGERLLLFASGKNRAALGGVDHWETAVYESDLWRWRLGTIAPPSNWNHSGFSASTWPNAPGGFGYGDGDDATQVAAGAISVYYRRVFTITDKSQLVRAILSMDYDDGFVAYLNGSEIARSDNISGSPDNTTLAVPEHEAVMFGGGAPAAFTLSAAQLDALLVEGDNILAVEIHNTAAGSSDLSGRTWLHFGIASDQQFFGAVPPWFDPGSSPLVLHTDFKLNFSERISLYDAAGTPVDSLDIGYLEPGHARMRLNDDGPWCVTAAPTPGEHNTGGCFSGYAATPAFSLQAGFYNGNQTVAISGSGEIRYTTDGSVPIETSTLYTAPLTVTATTVVRARNFELYKQPSAVATATYFIDDPTSLSVVSISLPPDDFTDVYTNYSAKGRVAVEFFDKNKERQFAGDFAGYVVGNWSVSFPQKSLQFDADEEFGSIGEIEYPIFADKPIDRYRSFRIRNEDDDYNSARMRDRIVNELAAPTHAGRASYLNVAAFINGEYWGHYVGRERIDNYFCRDNYGADPDSVNMVKTHYGQGDYVAEYGTIDDFIAMSDFIAGNDMAAPANFEKAGQLLDLENFTDYFATEIFVASTDWLQDFFNNIRLFKADKNDPWKFILWDVSYSSGNASGCADCDVLATTLADQSRYAQMFNSLLANPEYRRFFINRFADLMNTAFKTDVAHALIDANAAELGPEINRHHARWGTGGFNYWSNAVQFLKDFYTQRPAKQRQHIVGNFDLAAPNTITLEVEPAGAGQIKISTIVPQSLPWTGLYFNGNPVTVTAIANPGYTFDSWVANSYIGDTGQPVFTADVANSTVFVAKFNGSPAPISLKISEINYHSDPTRNAGDWFELRNTGNSPLDISDYEVRDADWFNRFSIPTGTVLAPGGHAVFVEDAGKFASENPGTTTPVVAIPFALDNSHDEIHLYDRSNAEAAWASYRDEKPWPCTPDGFGNTLERTDTGPEPDQPNSWFDGCPGGSPGDYFSSCILSPTVTEINYKSAPGADAGDWFEIWNRGSATLDISGWQIRDGNDDHIFMVPAGTTIPPDGHLVFYQDAAKFAAQHPSVVNITGPLGFGLDGNGDLIRVYDAAGRLHLSLCFDDAAPWPEKADGEGYTLEIEDLSGNMNDPYNWFSGCPGGSPGKAYDPLDCSVGASDPAVLPAALRVWPNPGSDVLHVRLDRPNVAHFRLLDVLGKTVLEQHAADGVAHLVTEGLPRGVYWLEAVVENERPAAKVVLH